MGAWLANAYWGHAGPVIVLLSDSAASWSGGEIAGIVPLQERLKNAPDFRYLHRSGRLEPARRRVVAVGRGVAASHDPAGACSFVRDRGSAARSALTWLRAIGRAVPTTMLDLANAC